MEIDAQNISCHPIFLVFISYCGVVVWNMCLQEIFVCPIDPARTYEDVSCCDLDINKNLATVSILIWIAPRGERVYISQIGNDRSVIMCHTLWSEYLLNIY